MLTPASSPPRRFTLVLLTILSMASLNLILPSLANMAFDFGITYGQASLAISVFMVITAALQLLVGPLSDLYGRRPVLLASLAIFVAASVGCALSTNFVVFMVFRCLQAAVITCNVLSRAIVRDTAEPRRATAILGTIGMAMALGPMLAPMAGGMLDQAFGWRACFHLMTLTGFGLLWLTWTDVGETNRARSAGVMAQIRSYPRLLRDPIFWSYTLCMSLSVATYFTFLTGVPLIAAEHFGLSGAMLGLALGVPPIGFLLGNLISSRMAVRVPGAVMLVAGRVITVVAMLSALGVWQLGLHSALAFFLFIPLIGVGNGLTNPAGSVGAMSVQPDLAGSAAGLSGTFMVGSGALMTAITGQVLSHGGTPLTLLLMINGTALLGLLAGLPALRDHFVTRRLSTGGGCPP